MRSRRSPLRLRTHGKQSAQQSNEIYTGSNDRFGLNRNGNESFEISLPDKVYTVVLYQYIAFCSVQARSSAGVESLGGGECRFRFI